MYDGLGRRRSKTAAGATTRFLYDGLNLVQEQSPGGTPTANLLTGLSVDETFARTDAAGTTYLLGDALGSTLELADTSGALQTHYAFGPFGTTSESGVASGNALQFTGRENDRTGLLFNRARYYSPQTLRFIAEDPLGFAGGDTNLYGYVGQAPIDDADPLGLFGLIDISNAIAGAGDSFTFGGTAMARRLLNDGCDPADTGSRAYRSGEAAEVVAEIALTAGSAALKQAAKQASREVVRQEARQMTRDIVRGEGQVLHHVNPLFGHPGNIPTLFPTGGLPAAIHSGSANVALVDAAEHAGIHRQMRRMERVGAAAVNPGTTAGRIIRNMMGRQCGCN